MDAPGAAAKSVVSVSGGAHVNSPAWSPDGAKLAHMQFAGRKTRLMVWSAGGDPQTVGTAEDVLPFPARWTSADELLYTATVRFW